MNPFPAFCRDCKHSRTKIDPYSENERPDRGLRCIHPKVNARNAWSLAEPNPKVTKECHYERDDTGWFAPCGQKGKLWEPKEPT
jgi:hypothetical protein